ncbi:hypothetical protein ES703_78178 [subsurface metagenome]
MSSWGLLWASARYEAGSLGCGASCLSFFLQGAISFMPHTDLLTNARACRLALIYHAQEGLSACQRSRGSPGIFAPARGAMPSRETSVDGLPLAEFLCLRFHWKIEHTPCPRRLSGQYQVMRVPHVSDTSSSPGYRKSKSKKMEVIYIQY